MSEFEIDPNDGPSVPEVGDSSPQPDSGRHRILRAVATPAVASAFMVGVLAGRYVNNDHTTEDRAQQALAVARARQAATAESDTRWINSALVIGRCVGHIGGWTGIVDRRTDGGRWTPWVVDPIMLGSADISQHGPEVVHGVPSYIGTFQPPTPEHPDRTVVAVKWDPAVYRFVPDEPRDQSNLSLADICFTHQSQGQAYDPEGHLEARDALGNPERTQYGAVITPGELISSR